MEGPSLNIDDLADELLSAQRGDPESDKEPEQAPKPGSKKYLIGQIEKVCEASGVPQEESHRELTRLSRSKLKELVAEYVTRAEKKRLADAIGAQSSSMCSLMTVSGRTRRLRYFSSHTERKPSARAN